MQPVDLNRILPSALLLAFESALICMDAGLSSKHGHGDDFSAVYGLYIHLENACIRFSLLLPRQPLIQFLSVLVRRTLINLQPAAVE